MFYCLICRLENKGDASNLTDFSLSAWSFSFGSNEGTRTLVLTLKPDCLAERSEQVSIGLVDLGQAGVTIGSKSTHSFTLNDDGQDSKYHLPTFI